MRRLIGILTLFLATAASARAAGSIETQVINLPGRGKLTLTLTPRGKATLERLATTTRVRIEIDRVPLPNTLAPAMNSYVVWAISPEGAAENLGELPLEGDKAQLDVTTALDRMGLLITAEPHYMVDVPSITVAYVGQPPPDPALRRVPVQVEIGRYGYSALKPVEASSGTSNLSAVVEARAALEVARNVSADRLAEEEFRLARVALETMEEMLARNNPSEIVLSAAHDAIRRAARATLVARESASGRNSAFRFGDELVDKASGNLTPEGQSTVEKIVASLQLLNGPARIRCSEATAAVVRRALVNGGVPETRIVFVR
ncbi:MAG TPA: DUF4398 domain-containing protein [Terriglobia bacterium]|nr:DUF4398 domain-containing protein [Terriglobia bacterium]